MSRVAQRSVFFGRVGPAGGDDHVVNEAVAPAGARAVVADHKQHARMGQAGSAASQRVERGDEIVGSMPPRNRIPAEPPDPHHRRRNIRHALQVEMLDLHLGPDAPDRGEVIRLLLDQHDVRLDRQDRLRTDGEAVPHSRTLDARRQRALRGHAHHVVAHAYLKGHLRQRRRKCDDPRRHPRRRRGFSTARGAGCKCRQGEAGHQKSGGRGARSEGRRARSERISGHASVRHWARSMAPEFNCRWRQSHLRDGRFRAGHCQRNNAKGQERGARGGGCGAVDGGR